VPRQDRHFERNKVFVPYLTVVEIAFTAVAYNHYLVIPLGLALLAIILLDMFLPIGGSSWLAASA